MIIEAAAIEAAAAFARKIMDVVEAFGRTGGVTEEQLQTIHAANQAKRAHVIGLLDALDDRDAAAKAAENG